MPVAARSNQIRTTLSVCCSPVGLIFWGAQAGGALAVQAWHLLPMQCPVLLAPVPPFSRTLTVQLHAQLGASALHLPPWGQRLLPSSRPPSMEGGSGAGSPPAAQPGRRARGQECPWGGTAQLSGSGPAAQRGRAISCCVATDLQAKSQRGPRARGTASCLRPLPPLARGAGRASLGASPAPGLSARLQRLSS